jgi:hypothetical protein
MLMSTRTSILKDLKEKIKKVESRKRYVYDFESVHPVNCKVSMRSKNITCDINLVDLETNVIVNKFENVTYTFDQLGYHS